MCQEDLSISGVFTKKMIVKGRPFEEIYDLVGIRVIVENVTDCYAALGTIHATWKPVQGRFKDYLYFLRFGFQQKKIRRKRGGIAFQLLYRLIQALCLGP